MYSVKNKIPDRKAQLEELNFYFSYIEKDLLQMSLGDNIIGQRLALAQLRKDMNELEREIAAREKGIAKYVLYRTGLIIRNSVLRGQMLLRNIRHMIWAKRALMKVRRAMKAMPKDTQRPKDGKGLPQDRRK